MGPIIATDGYIDPDVMGDMPKGLVPRDFQSFPMGAFAPLKDIPLIPWQDFPDLIREQEANKSRLVDLLLRAGIPSMNQNDPKYSGSRRPRWGYCWSYATVGCMITIREKMNQPYVPLSAFGLAYTQMNGEDRGGWSALSLDVATTRGVGPESLWPEFEQRMRPPESPFWAEAKKYRVTDGWAELTAPVYDRDLSHHQSMSLLMQRCPEGADYNWWGHAVQMLAVYDAFPNKDPKDPMRYGKIGRNSWGDSYGDRGFFRLQGQRCISDNSVVPWGVVAS